MIPRASRGGDDPTDQCTTLVTGGVICRRRCGDCREEEDAGKSGRRSSGWGSNHGVIKGARDE